MEDQAILNLFAQSTITVLIFGILIGSLFSIAILAIFDAIKAFNAKCKAEKAAAEKAAAKPVAVKKAPAKKAVAKKAPAKKAPVKKKPAAKKKK